MNLLQEIHMNKIILHVHIMYFLLRGCSNGKGQLDRIKIFYWRKILIIVDPMDILKSLGNKSCLASSHLYIHFLFVLVDPSASNKIFIWRKKNYIPSLVLKHRIVLLLHGFFLEGVPYNLFVGLWVRRMNYITMNRHCWFSDNAYMRKILKIISGPPWIKWIPNKVACILKCGLFPLGHLLWILIYMY